MVSFLALAFLPLIVILQTQKGQASRISPHDDHPEPYELAKDIYNVIFAKKQSTDLQQTSYFTSIEINNTLVLNKGIFEMVKEISHEQKKNTKLMQLNLELEAIAETVRNVEDNYQKLSTYAEFLWSRNTRSFAIESFARSAIDENDCSMRRSLKDVSSKIIRDHVKSDEDAVQNLMLDSLQDYRSLCNSNKSLSMMIVELYDIIIKTEIKWMVITNFAYDVLGRYNTGQYDYHLDLQLMELETSVRTQKIKENLRDAGVRAPREVWSCDPLDNLESRASLGEATLPERNVYFNLEPVQTDLTESQWMIMTGARFNRRVTDKIDGKIAEEIYLEIQQGVLMNDGSIDSSTVGWKNSLNKENPRRYLLRVNETSMRLTTEDPFHRNLFLTGLQFFVANETTINLQAFHSFDPRDGTSSGHMMFSTFLLPLRRKDLDDDQELNALVSHIEDFEKYVHLTRSRTFMGVPYHSMTKDETVKYRLDQSHMNALDKSQCKHQQSKNLTRYFKHVVFEESPGDREGAENVVVPFVDLQEVVTDPPVPLTGVGIYHKGTKGCKSYLALELLTQVFEEHWYKT